MIVSLLDKHALPQRKVTVILPRLPLYTDTPRELKVKLERRMLLTGLQEDKMTHRSTRDEYTRVLNDNKSKYYADSIEGSTGDIKKPFSIKLSLLSLANDFVALFIKKSELIQEDIDNIVVSQPEVDSYHLHSKLERFYRLTEDSVQRIIMSSNNATRTLDPMPTWLIKRCSDVLKPTITQLLNLSLLEGHVPAPWKTLWLNRC